MPFPPGHPYHLNPEYYTDSLRYADFASWVHTRRKEFRESIAEDTQPPVMLDDERHNNLLHPRWSATPSSRYDRRQVASSNQLWNYLAAVDPISDDNTIRAFVDTPPGRSRPSASLRLPLTPQRLATLQAIWLGDEAGRVTSDNINADRIFEQLAHHPTPCLKRVYIQNLSPAMPINVRNLHTIPQRLAISAVHLEGCRLSHTSSFLQCNLHTLELIRCNNVWNTFSEFSDTLRRMPRLATLTLGHGTLPPSASASWPINIEPANLSHMQSITLSGELVQLYTALPCLTLNHKAKLRLNPVALPQSEANATHYYRLATVVEKYLRATWKRTGMHTVHLEGNTAGEFVIRAHFGLNESSPDDVGEDGSLYIKICTPNHKETYDINCVFGGTALLWGLVSSLESCRCLVISHMVFRELARQQLWWSITQSMPFIKCLILAGGEAASLVHVLQESHAQGSYPTYFPGLQYLSIQCGDFRRMYHGQMTLYDELGLVLHRRREVGAGPTHIDIQKSGISRGMVAALTQAMRRPGTLAPGKVYWDNITSIAR
ncbi:hypothetical protein FA95DRAFT_1560960 [Auriscalpium vulgare]|uniref:Uncharacterized protein n=1 Tax=Auriscalpium vulgare TaxID=40419 RepID=A0ACB8RNR3_9AGAM|nr:hypothetical protein FA95DRAFT_1560960 [Auriscalpium vulgare]